MVHEFWLYRTFELNAFKTYQLSLYQSYNNTDLLQNDHALTGFIKMNYQAVISVAQ